MAKYNLEQQVVHTDMLQTPVIGTPNFDFRINPNKVDENNFNSLTAEQNPASTIQLNLANARLRMKRDKGKFNDCSANSDGSNKVSKVDYNTATLPHLQLTSPFLKSPMDDFNISPIDLRTPTSNQNSSNNGIVSDFSQILDMTSNQPDTSSNGNLYDEQNSGIIKIANTFLAQSQNQQTQMHQQYDRCNMALNYVMESNEFTETKLEIPEPKTEYSDQKLEFSKPKLEYRTLDNDLNKADPDSTVGIAKDFDASISINRNGSTEQGACVSPTVGKIGRNTSKRGKTKKEGNSFECSQCKRVYKWKFNLNRHKKFECNKENAFECTICFQKFPYKQNCTQHILRTHSIKLPTNEYITQGFIKFHATLDTFGKATALPLMKTEETHEFECGVCGHQLSYQQSIIEHLKTTHDMHVSVDAYFANGLIKFVKR